MIHSLPETTHEQDKEWVSDKLNTLTPTMRTRAVIGYDSVFNETLANTPIEHQKLNRARYAANTRLRLFIDRFHLASLGYTDKPPLHSQK